MGTSERALQRGSTTTIVAMLSGAWGFGAWTAFVGRQFARLTLLSMGKDQTKTKEEKARAAMAGGKGKRKVRSPSSTHHDAVMGTARPVYGYSLTHL